MKNAFTMEVWKAEQSLPCEWRDNRLFKFAVLADARPYTATRNVFEKDRNAVLFAFASEVLHNVGVVKMLHGIDLLIQTLHKFFDLVFIGPSGFGVDLDLFDSDKLSGGDVHTKVDATKCAFADELTLHPFECWLPRRDTW